MARRKEKVISFMLIIAAFMLLSFAETQAQSQQETLSQFVADFQKNPGDDALREKIIKLAQSMDPAPKIPEEARRHFVKGAALFREAKSAEDFIQVIDEFKQAVGQAPWWPEACYNLALAWESAGKYHSAIANLKIYLIFKLPADEARAVQDKIYILEAKAEKAEKQSSLKAAAAQKEDEYTVWLKSINGAKFIGQGTEDGRIGYERCLRFLVYYINGSEVHHGWIEGVRASDDLRWASIRDVDFSDGRPSQTLVGKQFTIPVPDFFNDRRPCTGTISEDGKFLTVLCPTSSVPESYTRMQ